VRIQKNTAEDYPTPPRGRPIRDEIAARLCVALPPWRSSLATCIARLMASDAAIRYMEAMTRLIIDLPDEAMASPREGQGVHSYSLRLATSAPLRRNLLILALGTSF